MTKYFTREEDAVIRDAWVEQKPDTKVGGVGIFDEELGKKLGRSTALIGYRRRRLGMNAWKLKTYSKKSRSARRPKWFPKPTESSKEKTATPKACFCQYCGMKNNWE